MVRQLKLNRMIKLQSPIVITRSSRDGISHVATVKGHKLYKWDSIGHLPKIREMGVRFASEEMKLGLMRSDSDKADQLIMEAVNNGDLGTIASITTARQSYRKLYASARMMINLGGWGMLVDDEPLGEITAKHIGIKKELAKDIEVRAFFFTSAIGYLMELAQITDDLKRREFGEKVMTSLEMKERQTREQLFLKKLGKGLTSDLWDVTYLTGLDG